jgi:hypothetical protein
MLRIPGIVITDHSPIFSLPLLGNVLPIEAALAAIQLTPKIRSQTLDQLITALEKEIVTTTYSGYNFDMNALYDILIKIRDTSGVEEFQEQVVPYVMALIHHPSESYHICISGFVEKELVASFLARILKVFGKISNDNVQIVSRSNFVARYIGQTAAKTQQILDDNRCSVLLIEEAYSL